MSITMAATIISCSTAMLAAKSTAQCRTCTHTVAPQFSQALTQKTVIPANGGFHPK